MPRELDREQRQALGLACHELGHLRGVRAPREQRPRQRARVVVVERTERVVGATKDFTDAPDAPLGGAPWFFVTGVAGGFGYNRALQIPDVSKVKDLPFFTLMSRSPLVVEPIPASDPATPDISKPLRSMVTPLAITTTAASTGPPLIGGGEN